MGSHLFAESPSLNPTDGPGRRNTPGRTIFHPNGPDDHHASCLNRQPTSHQFRASMSEPASWLGRVLRDLYEKALMNCSLVCRASFPAPSSFRSTVSFISSPERRPFENRRKVLLQKGYILENECEERESELRRRGRKLYDYKCKGHFDDLFNSVGDWSRAIGKDPVCSSSSERVAFASF